MTDGTVPERLISMEDTRFLHCNIKTLNLIPSVIASQRAFEAGCSETVLYRAGAEERLVRLTDGAGREYLAVNHWNALEEHLTALAGAR